MPSYSQTVIERERRGDYLGKTVQVVPHITDEIQVGCMPKAAGKGQRSLDAVVM